MPSNKCYNLTLYYCLHYIIPIKNLLLTKYACFTVFSTRPAIRHLILQIKCRCYSVCQHPLTVEDIESILDTLVYDGKVAAETRASADEDGVGQSQSVRCYRCLTAWCPPTGITRLPCAMCPVVLYIIMTLFYSTHYIYLLVCLSVCSVQVGNLRMKNGRKYKFGASAPGYYYCFFRIKLIFIINF